VKECVRGLWEGKVKMMECGCRDLNKSRGAGYPVCERSHNAGRSFARRSVCVCVCVCGWGRTFVLRRLASERTIAQGGAIVRFLSVCSLIESTSANDRPRRCDRSLHQCV
jgi:hypothetical protein